jgi:hypothetical protein
LIAARVIRAAARDQAVIKLPSDRHMRQGLALR